MNPIEIEFKTTCKLLLGSELPGVLDDYDAWLGKYVPLPFPVKSAVSGKEVWAHPGQNYLKKELDLHQTIAMDETGMMNKAKMDAPTISGLSIRQIISTIRPIAYYCGSFRYGEFENVEKCSGAGGGSNLYYCEDVYFGARNCGYCNFTSYSENMFGCNASPFSKFCIHAYNSSNITRCFEVDGCTDSSGLYFCHNCEGMSNAILCFNAKNLRYAVGNVEVGPVEFARAKRILVNSIVNAFREKKEYEIGIYNVGCRTG